MSQFVVDGRMTVRTLKASFLETFGYSLRVYKGNNAGSGARFADDDTRLGEVADERDSLKELGSFEVGPGMTVEQFEKEFQAKYDIAVQIADAKNEKLLDNKTILMA